jgi:gliding motility-associated-like protein
MMGAGTISSYLWKWGDGSTSNTFEPVHQYASDDTFSVTLIATAMNGCVDSITKPVVTYALENSSFRLSKPFQDFICEGTNLKLSASGAFSYQWYLDNKPIAGAKDSVYQAVKSGAYSVVFFNQLGCQSKPNGNIKLTINPKPKADFSYEGYCLGSPTKFTDKSKVDSLNKIKYLWNFGDGSQTVQVASPTHTFTKSGEYKVSLIVQSMVCPNQTDTSTIKIEPETPKKGKKYESESVVDGKSKKLEARDFGVKYQWIPSTYLDNPNIREPKYTAGKEQKYLIRITSKAGCVTTDTLQVLSFDKCNVIVPGGFSPNDDGKNDRLYPFQIGMKSMKVFRIYDRFGNLVFDDKNANSATGWDGKYKGKKLPVGSYVWIAEGTGEDDQQIKRTGNVMLVR